MDVHSTNPLRAQQWWMHRALSAWVWMGYPSTHLSFRKAEAVRQLLPFRSHHVMILLEGVLQP